MVIDQGIVFIALGDRLQPSEIQEILGLIFVGTWSTSDDLKIQNQHFITNGLKYPLDYSDARTQRKQRAQVKLLNGTETLVEQRNYPQVTIREHEAGAHGVWIGGDIDVMFSYQEIRTRFRRAITLTFGLFIY